jgi:hypothetical protein
MTGQQAGDVLALLVAAFPDAALDDESSSFFVSEIARLADYEAALDAATLCAREARKFPSLAEFRQTYRTRSEARRPMRALEESSGPRVLPAEAVEALLRLQGMDEAEPPPKLPAVEAGKCEDCGSAGERVAYGRFRLCGGCARKRVRVAAKLVETTA